MEVEPLDTNFPKRRYRRSLLLVLIGIIIVIQACSANLVFTTNGVTPHIYLGDSVVIKGDVYDDHYPDVAIQKVPVQVVVASDSGVSQNLNYNTTTLGKSFLCTLHNEQAILHLISIYQ